jgi:predicted HTH domain antitoxin
LGAAEGQTSRDAVLGHRTGAAESAAGGTSQGAGPRLRKGLQKVEVTVKLPENVANSFGKTSDDIGRHLLEIAAIEAYRTGQLSHRQVGTMLGLDYWETESFLRERGVPVNYSLADLEADRATLDQCLFLQP